MAQMRVLENEELKIQVSDDGAELCSIYDKAKDSLSISYYGDYLRN